MADGVYWLPGHPGHLTLSLFTGDVMAYGVYWLPGHPGHLTLSLFTGDVMADGVYWMPGYPDRSGRLHCHRHGEQVSPRNGETGFT